MTELDIAKLTRLVTAGRELVDKQTAVFDEIDAILGGKASIGDLIRDGRRAFQEAWSSRYGGQPYAWNNTRDMAQMKRLVKMLGGAEFSNRCGRYIQNSDPFVVKTRHSFALFVSSINQYATEAPTGELVLDGDDQTPIGCRHRPACPNDVAHTAKLRAEARA